MKTLSNYPPGVTGNEPEINPPNYDLDLLTINQADTPKVGDKFIERRIAAAPKKVYCRLWEVKEVVGMFPQEQYAIHCGKERRVVSEAHLFLHYVAVHRG